MNLASWATRLPWSIVVVSIVLFCLGWLGIARSEAFSDAGGRLLQRQVIWSLLSLLAMLLVTIPNYRVLSRYSYGIFAASIGLLIAVYFFPTINGTHRWIRVGPLGMQPSEFAKVAFVLAIARYLMYRENYRNFTGLLVPLCLSLLPVLLILREPDLGTSTLFVPILLLMLFAAGIRLRHLVLTVMAGLLTLPLLWTQMSGEQRSRVTALFEQTTPDDRPTGDTYHLHQAKRMMALGGLFGNFITEDTEDYGTVHPVPEAATDSIYAVLGERLGQVGLAGILLLYLVLVWRGLRIAESTREPFGRLVATGIVALIGVQVVINTGMMVGLMPITGLSLPLVSYGGSGLLASGLSMGLLLNIGLRPGYEVTREPFRFVDAK